MFALHGVLGLLPIVLFGAIVMVSDTLPQLMSLLMLVGAGVLGGAPLAGYLWLLRGPQSAIPDDEPCTRTGRVLGLHWFEFASLPHERLWTRDALLADSVRARPHPMPAGGDGVDWVMTPKPSDRRALQIDAALTNAMAVTFGIGVGALSFLGVGWILAIGAALVESDTVFLAAGLALSLLVGSVTVSVWTVFFAQYAIVFALGFQLWDAIELHRRTKAIRWTGTSIVTENGGFALDADDVGIALEQDVFGSVLRLTSAQQALTLRAEHTILAPLAEAILERDQTAPEEQRRVRQALADVH